MISARSGTAILFGAPMLGLAFCCVGCGHEDAAPGGEAISESDSIADVLASIGDHGQELVAGGGGEVFERADARLSDSLKVSLPKAANGEIVFKLQAGSESGSVIRVRENEAIGGGEQRGRTVVYARQGGETHWLLLQNGAENWIHVREGLAYAGSTLASWSLAGGSAREVADAVEIVDDAGVVRMRVTAPIAVTRSGRRIVPQLVAEPTTIRVSADADGEEIAIDPAWVVASSLAVGRYDHAAARMADGRVLLSGGRDIPGGMLAEAEIFDPVTSTWSVTDAPAIGRVDHTLTLLSNGKLIAVGGELSMIPGAAGTERFDPVTSQWSNAGDIGYRIGHSATALPDGRLFVAGGHYLAPLVETLFYQPTPNTWVEGPDAPTARDRHSANLLADGTVLLCGGKIAGGVVTNTCDRFNPSTNAFSTAAPMVGARYRHPSVLLEDGRVLVAGGLGPGDVELASAEIYDPTVGATGAWTSIAPMSIPRTLHAAALDQDGMALMCGNGQLGTATTTERYDAAAGAWENAGSMIAPREFFTATRLANGRVLVSGGAWQLAVTEVTSDLGDACNVGSDCLDGNCSDGVCCSTACDAGPCDACSIAAGALIEGQCRLLTGPSCDDEDACSETSSCQLGVCVGERVKECASGPCQLGECNAVTGLCLVRSDDTPCDDGDGCTVDDVCVAGACTSGAPLSCEALDECHSEGECMNGACSNPAKSDGTPCEGGTCLDGECASEMGGNAPMGGNSQMGGNEAASGGAGGGNGAAGEPDGGCGCATRQGGSKPWALLVLGLALLRWRRHARGFTAAIAAAAVLMACGDDTSRGGNGPGGAVANGGSASGGNGAGPSGGSPEGGSTAGGGPLGGSPTAGSSEGGASNGGAGQGGASTGGAGEGGEGGSPSVCTPGATMPCYDGPSGTEGMGTCAGGLRTCEDDGSEFGPCEGQVLPTNDDCLVAGDQDCNGTDTTCTTVEWARQIGSTTSFSYDQAYALATDAAGDIYVAGNHDGNLTIAGEQLTNPLADAMFVARTSSVGAPVWGDSFLSTTSDKYVTGLAVDDVGNSYLVGAFGGTVLFGAIQLTSVGLRDGFLAKLDSSGSVVWANAYGSPGFEELTDIAWDPASDTVVVSGYFNGPTDFGTGVITPNGQDIAIMRVTDMGTTEWVTTAGDDSQWRQIDRISVAPNGFIYFGGRICGSMTIGGTTVSGSCTVSHDAFFGKLSPVGAGLWLKAFVGGIDETVNGIGVLPSGDVVISGPFGSVINLGGAALDFANGGHAFLARFTPGGQHVWSINHGGTPADLAGSASGDLLVAGSFIASVNLGGGMVTSLGSTDIYVAKYDSSGSYQSAVTLGSTSGDYASRVHFSANGDLLLLGWVSSPVDLGGATLTPVGSEGILAKLTL